MPTRIINLTEHFDQFVKNEIAVGRYKNASEVLRAGLRLLEQQAREGFTDTHNSRAAVYNESGGVDDSSSQMGGQ